MKEYEYKSLKEDRAYALESIAQTIDRDLDGHARKILKYYGRLTAEFMSIEEIELAQNLLEAISHAEI